MPGWKSTRPLQRALRDVVVGQQIMLITWLHKAHRKTLKVHPRGDINLPTERCICHAISG